MAEQKLSNEDERRLTRVEDALTSHIQTCEANSRETKYWTRFIGAAVILFIGKVVYAWATTGRLPG